MGKRRERLLTGREVQLLYGVSGDLIKHWRHRGFLEGRHVSPRKIFYKQSDIEKLLSQRKPEALDQFRATKGQDV